MDANDGTFIRQDFFTPESMDRYVAEYNSHVANVVSYMKLLGYDARLADVHSALTKADLHDGVHPSEEGFKKLGTFWYETLKNEILDK